MDLDAIERECESWCDRYGVPVAARVRALVAEVRLWRAAPTATSYAELYAACKAAGMPVSDRDAAERELQAGIEAGTVTLNQWRAARNRPPVDGGDVPARDALMRLSAPWRLPPAEWTESQWTAVSAQRCAELRSHLEAPPRTVPCPTWSADRWELVPPDAHPAFAKAGSYRAVFAALGVADPENVDAGLRRRVVENAITANEFRARCNLPPVVRGDSPALDYVAAPPVAYPGILASTDPIYVPRQTETLTAPPFLPAEAVCADTDADGFVDPPAHGRMEPHPTLGTIVVDPAAEREQANAHLDRIGAGPELRATVGKILDAIDGARLATFRDGFDLSAADRKPDDDDPPHVVLGGES